MLRDAWRRWPGWMKAAVLLLVPFIGGISYRFIVTNQAPRVLLRIDGGQGVEVEFEGTSVGKTPMVLDITEGVRAQKAAGLDGVWDRMCGGGGGYVSFRTTGPDRLPTWEIFCSLAGWKTHRPVFRFDRAVGVYFLGTSMRNSWTRTREIRIRLKETP